MGVFLFGWGLWATPTWFKVSAVDHVKALEDRMSFPGWQYSTIATHHPWMPWERTIRKPCVWTLSLSISSLGWFNLYPLATVNRNCVSITAFSKFCESFSLEKAMNLSQQASVWRIPGTTGLVGCCLWGPHKNSDTTEVTLSSSSESF